MDVETPSVRMTASPFTPRSSRATYAFYMLRFTPLAALFACAAMAQTGATLQLTFQDAMARARAVNPQLLSASLAAQIAHEDAVQAKAALLPTVQGFSQFRSEEHTSELQSRR